MEQAISASVSMVLQRVGAQQDVFLCGPLPADEQAALLTRLTALGSGVVISASRRRLAEVGEQLAGRRLKIERKLRGAPSTEVANADVELLALQQIESFSGTKDWALLLDDVLGFAMDSYTQRRALREVIARVDAACVLIDLQALCSRYSALLCLEPNAPAAMVNGAGLEPVAPPAAVDDVVFEAMRVWRRERAQERGVPAFRVMSDRVMRDVINEAPKDLAGLRMIPGIGDKTIETLGKDLLGTLAAVRGSR